MAKSSAKSSSSTTFDPVELFDAGGLFYLDEMPVNSEFGIDYQCWRTGERFRGVKMIPPGIHFIYYSVSEKHSEQVGMRAGFFHDFGVRESLVCRWNRSAECVDTQTLSDEQRDEFQRRRRELDPNLGAYPFDVYKRWLSLSNYLSVELINALAPKSGVITSETSLIGQPFKKSAEQTMKQDDKSPKRCNPEELETKVFDMSQLKEPKSLKEAESKLPEMKKDESCSINFTKIPTSTQTYPSGSTSNEITKHSIDLSYKLELFVNEQHRNMKGRGDPLDDVLGELQYAFICFLVGNVYDAFEHWKHLFGLLCNCEQAVGAHPDFYLNLLNALYYQLNEMPLDFFTDITTSDNFLVVHMHNLFDNVRDVCSKKRGDIFVKMSRRCEQFKNYLQQKFNFDFDLEPDEYAPVICDEDGVAQN